jgi:hypothetical protein
VDRDPEVPPYHGGALWASIPFVRAKNLIRRRTWGQILGTVCGTVESRSYRFEATRKAICWPFVKPSDGLEPSTPSLPWRLKRSKAGRRSRASRLVFVGLCGFAVLFDVFLDLPRVAQRSPVPVPKTYPQTVVLLDDVELRRDELSRWLPNRGTDRRLAGAATRSSRGGRPPRSGAAT